jgi:hypothetical protein
MSLGAFQTYLTITTVIGCLAGLHLLLVLCHNSRLGGVVLGLCISIFLFLLTFYPFSGISHHMEFARGVAIALGFTLLFGSVGAVWFAESVARYLEKRLQQSKQGVSASAPLVVARACVLLWALCCIATAGGVTRALGASFGSAQYAASDSSRLLLERAAERRSAPFFVARDGCRRFHDALRDSGARRVIARAGKRRFFSYSRDGFAALDPASSSFVGELSYRIVITRYTGEIPFLDYRGTAGETCSIGVNRISDGDGRVALEKLLKRINDAARSFHSQGENELRRPLAFIEYAYIAAAEAITAPGHQLIPENAPAEALDLWVRRAQLVLTVLLLGLLTVGHERYVARMMEGSDDSASTAAVKKT